MVLGRFALMHDVQQADSDHRIDNQHASLLMLYLTLHRKCILLYQWCSYKLFYRVAALHFSNLYGKSLEKRWFLTGCFQSSLLLHLLNHRQPQF